MSRKTLYILLTVALLPGIGFLLQPLKKGEGYNTATKYQIESNWPALPEGLKLGNPTGLALDTQQNIVVLHRGEREWPLFGSMPHEPISQKTVLIINKNNGKLINSWGDQLLIMPHGLEVDHENNIWITDVGLHQVFKFSYEGKLLLKLGEAGVPGADSLHFNQPTDIAIAKDGSFYVSDGYGNSRIIRFSANGNYLSQWGKKGNKAGEFNIPHSIALNYKGEVYVADRENNRVQVFNSTGTFIKQLSHPSWGAVNAISFDASGSTLLAADDVSFLKIKHRGSDLFIFDSTNQVQTRWGRSGYYEGPVCWYHDLVMDGEGNIYVGDILGNTIQKFKKVAAY